MSATEGGGFILIQANKGEAAAIAGILRGLGGVETIHRVMGPYDLIVRLKAQPTPERLAAVERLPGVVRTVACAVGSS